jgi:hypothetical protein
MIEDGPVSPQDVAEFCAGPDFQTDKTRKERPSMENRGEIKKSSVLSASSDADSLANY